MGPPSHTFPYSSFVTLRDEGVSGIGGSADGQDGAHDGKVMLINTKVITKVSTCSNFGPQKGR